MEKKNSRVGNKDWNASCNFKSIAIWDLTTFEQDLKEVRGLARWGGWGMFQARKQPVQTLKGRKQV